MAGQTIGQRDRDKKKLGKRLFLKRLFGNSIYLTHFSCYINIALDSNDRQMVEGQNKFEVQ